MFYTDYPIVKLGDTAGEKAPIRSCYPFYYDGDKYTDVIVDDVIVSFKSGYIYTTECRSGEGVVVGSSDYNNTGWNRGYGSDLVYFTRDKYKVTPTDHKTNKWVVMVGGDVVHEGSGADCILWVDKLIHNNDNETVKHRTHQCPDGGTCHHLCRTSCFRVECCGPLSGEYPNDEWPLVIQMNPTPYPLSNENNS